MIGTAPYRPNSTLRGYAVLGAGAPDPAAIYAQILASSGVNPGAVSSSGAANIKASIAAAELLNNGAPAYVPGTASCAAAGGGSSSGANDLKLAGSAGSLSLQAATTTGLIAAGPATLGISIAIAGIVGLFGTILNHHAQAVQKEQSTLCSAVPAANNYLTIIDQALQSGQATPAEAIQALDSLESDFESAVSSIRKMGGGSCNAACVMTLELRGVVAYRTALYQELAATQAAAPAPTNTTAGSGPTTAAPVSSGSTMQLPVASTPASSSAGSAVTAPAGAPLTAPAVPAAPWLPIAALFIVGALLSEVL